jgi:hypothetical protein
MPLNFVAKAAITVALTAANTALQMTRKIEGPRLEELGASVGDYGASIPDIFGTRRVNPPVFWAEDLREVKRRRKTKGGKYNEYTYYGTWACALAAHEIDGVTRIWFDTHLVYDATGAGPLSPFDFGGTGQISDFITFYLGTMTQDPDERIAATVEAAEGAGSCPAYHGIAYVVFKDLPLEKLGNRIPQVSVEVVSNASNAFPTELLDLDYVTGGGNRLSFSPDYSVILVHGLGGAGDGEAVIIDTAARAKIIHHTGLDFGVTSAHRGGAISDDGTFYATNGLGTGAYSVGTGGGITGYAVRSYSNRGTWILRDASGVEHWLTGYSTSEFSIDDVSYDTDALTGTAWGVHCFFRDRDGDIWVFGGDATDIYFMRMPIGGAVFALEQVTAPGLAGAQRNCIHYRSATLDQFVFTWDSEFHIFDRATATITVSTSALPNNLAREPWSYLPQDAETIWLDFTEASLADLSVVRSFTESQWGTSYGAAGLVYDPVNHALVDLASDTIRWFYLDRIAGNGVTLGSIAADRAVKVGVEDYDFTTLDQIIPGWSVTQGQASSQLEPLFDAYDSDILPHEFEIIGKKRAGVPASTLLTENFVAGDPRYTAKVRQSAELPFALTYNFADLNADQQPNNVRTARPQDAQAGRDERSIDMTTLANDADGMRGLAERHFRRMHGERREVELGLTTQQIALEPGDVRTLSLDGDLLTARLLKTTISPAGTIGTEWKYDHASFAVLSGATGAEMDGRPVSVVATPLLSKGFFLDIPYISDGDARTPPSIYIAAAPYAAGAWPGAVAFQAIDGEYSDEIGAVVSSAAATWGYANDALVDANPWLWDRLSEVNVTLQNGTLTGCTEAQIDADPTLNLALIGDEIVNFTSATLEMDGTWTLSGLKRGRRGTEWACSTHAARDVVLLMDATQAVSMGLAEVDTNLSFKMITSGRSSGFAIDMEPFNGASLMPYAPVHLIATLSGSDWVFTWVRRTRLGGAWTGGAAIPLSEASEEYELYLGDGITTVTKTVTSATTYTWTAAQQTTDTGSGVTSGELTFSIAQVSDAVGAGFVAVY